MFGSSDFTLLQATLYTLYRDFARHRNTAFPIDERQEATEAPFDEEEKRSTARTERNLAKN